MDGPGLISFNIVFHCFQMFRRRYAPTAADGGGVTVQMVGLARPADTETRCLPWKPIKYAGCVFEAVAIAGRCCMLYAGYIVYVYVLYP